MEQMTIGKRFTLICPEGFRTLSEEEKDRVHAASGADSLYLMREADRMIVSAGWKEVNALAGILLHVFSPVASMEAAVNQSMAGYGFRRETRLTRQIAGQKAEGFRYTYTAGDNPMVGESYVIRQGRSLTFFHAYFAAALRDQALVRWNQLLDAVEAM